MRLFKHLRPRPRPSAFVSLHDYRVSIARQRQGTPLIMEQLRKFAVSGNMALKVEFFFYTDRVEKAAALARELEQLGYLTYYDRSAGDDQKYCISGWTTPLLMDADAVLEWATQMCATGFRHDCEFDGWGTSPTQ